MSTQQDVSNLDSLVSEIEKFIGVEKISLVNILSICLYAMQIVEKYPNMKGNDKKELVIHAFKIILEKTNVDKDICNLLPSFIDNAVNIEKGKVRIAGVDTEVAISCCFNLCGSGNQKK